MRLDQLLVSKGHYQSRTKAIEGIKDGFVKVNDVVETKPSKDIADDSKIEIIGSNCPYVSRGGLKLEAAIKAFNLDFENKVIVDIGASTGGFTDCALSFKAKKVYAIDVGTDQLAPKLLDDDRVVSLQQTNIKDIDFFPEPIDYYVMDVSFVSITHLIPTLVKYINENNALICLIKPQFEAGKQYMKNGIVKDSNTHLRVINNVMEELKIHNMNIKKLIPSPILGGSGNREFLAYITLGTNTNINVLEVVK